MIHISYPHPNLVTMFQANIAAEQRARSKVVQTFKRRLIEYDGMDDNHLLGIVNDSLPMIDRMFCWPQAMRAVVGIDQKLHPRLRHVFYIAWAHHGDHIRTEVGNDCLLIDALRKLLPPIAGGPVTLYRGESLRNHQRRTYGLSWTSLRYIAQGYAEHPWGSAGQATVLIKAHVPESAIIAKTNSGYDRYGEKEYIVDRRKLNSVRVVKEFLR
jgi:hypothetical protein